MANITRGASLKERELLYRLMISQLFYDGYQTLAVNLSTLVKCTPACPPSDRLLHLVNLGLKTEAETKEAESAFIALSTGIDLDFETESSTNAPEPGSYETVYVTSHKGPCRSGVFNSDGSLVATGSVDASIKILDVEKMIAKSSIGTGDDSQLNQQNEAHHPVIRTLYDHMEEVTCLQFHPVEQLLASGSQDMTIKLYDFAKPSVKRALKTIQEASTIRCLSFHPTGDFLLVGTQHPVLRMYDVNTCQCFVGPNPADQHLGPITMINFSNSGALYVSASKDGDIKLWDGVSSRCINTFPRAHDGYEICSVVFSRNGKYVLSSGKDSLVKLWELSMSRCLIAYTGAGTAGKQLHRAQAVFNHTEDYVLFPDERTTSLCVWDSRNAERQKLLSLGHNNAVRQFCHSPTAPAFLTCSDDYRARFWYKKLDSVSA
ncbi:cleavage stimulation factor subunit 1-like protein [Dinothrombium tinctorium]|uniref:Cleavage stimulation factor 50 kDa subunit n=1 Tax=Dinothrombium tinctorium TaxID=1965070 RepID=A0A443RDX2_9ACAR|nr:cleavage stimulation factor subunit 1-like protein [Dinothrombium tinctorium]RWS13460.1 cleavage stimulation factor subunit 1-like protein [Dinothrombium tinctorium]RWS13464.1 cleavage stimulation factor subunit 1-like protein [Dinothrombium tinctorium]